MKIITLSLLVCLAGLAADIQPVAAQSAVSQLKAPRVKKRIRLQLIETGDDGKKVAVQYALDDSTDFHNLADDRTFLASGPVLITVRRFNPLRTAVTVTINDADDPSHAALGKLVEALLGLATVVGAKLEKGSEPTGLANEKQLFRFEGALRSRGLQIDDCAAEMDPARSAAGELDAALNNPLWSSSNIKNALAAWSERIDVELNSSDSGPVAIAAGLHDIDALIGPAEGTDGSSNEPEKHLGHALKQLDEIIKKVEAALTKKAESSCEKAAEDVYTMLRLTNPYQRQQTFLGIYKTIATLRTSLAAYGKASRWLVADKAEFIAKDSIEPTNETMKKVSLAFSSLRYDVPSPLSSITVKKEDLVTSKMELRRYAPWVPEIGAGLTFAKVNRRKFGTGTNDSGKTVITEADPDKSSLDPTLMMNFLCGFCGASGFTPMLQVGTSTSKSTPAVFLGGGIRLLPTSKGDVALGIGYVIPFAKQLKDGVNVGDEIDGTAALENKLEWQRVNGAVYVNLQYKF